MKKGLENDIVPILALLLLAAYILPIEPFMAIAMVLSNALRS